MLLCYFVVFVFESERNDHVDRTDNSTDKPAVLHNESHQQNIDDNDYASELWKIFNETE